MTRRHMTKWEQEEYVLQCREPGGPATEVDLHLDECAACRSAVDELEQGITLFRDAAISWSEDCLKDRAVEPCAVRQINVTGAVTRTPVLRWAMAAAVILLLLLVPLYRASVHRAVTTIGRTVPSASAALPLSDDALLQQVDQQVSEEVPASMESLTHLVSTDGSADTSSAATRQKGRYVERN